MYSPGRPPRAFVPGYILFALEEIQERMLIDIVMCAQVPCWRAIILAINAQERVTLRSGHGGEPLMFECAALWPMGWSVKIVLYLDGEVN